MKLFHVAERVLSATRSATAVNRPPETDADRNVSVYESARCRLGQADEQFEIRIGWASRIAMVGGAHPTKNALLQRGPLEQGARVEKLSARGDQVVIS